MFVGLFNCSYTMKKSWTCSMELEIQKVAAGSRTLRFTRTPVAASTPLGLHPDWCTQRKRWLPVCLSVHHTVHFWIQCLFKYVSSFKLKDLLLYYILSTTTCTKYISANVSMCADVLQVQSVCSHTSVVKNSQEVEADQQWQSNRRLLWQGQKGRRHGKNRWQRPKQRRQMVIYV